MEIYKYNKYKIKYLNLKNRIKGGENNDNGYYVIDITTKYKNVVLTFIKGVKIYVDENIICKAETNQCIDDFDSFEDKYNTQQTRELINNISKIFNELTYSYALLEVSSLLFNFYDINVNKFSSLEECKIYMIEKQKHYLIINYN